MIGSTVLSVCIKDSRPINIIKHLSALSCFDFIFTAFMVFYSQRYNTCRLPKVPSVNGYIQNGRYENSSDLISILATLIQGSEKGHCISNYLVTRMKICPRDPLSLKQKK